ncbi:hypothetical protein NE237_013326 [Protea cynaroides]|uniref:F-box domain-containing protein n=1 Tax=Protea cynaroides TaxID=273540 RepID=A0A9Q0H1H4_9MAGN|nr:hypothetical protein NE237_013326 [Protea cynaroides]
MDTLIQSPSPQKRPCCVGDPLPIEFSRISTPEQMNNLLEAFLGLSDSSSVFFDCSLERLLESRASDSEQNQMIERVLKLGSVLIEAGERSARKLACKHNSIVWALPPDLTFKVFSLLDTRSLCYAAATCSMFHKFSMEPLCYSNIDLTSIVPKVNNAVVSAMIQKAGKDLQSLKLGILSSPTVCSTKNSVNASGYSWNSKKSRQCKESCVLTRSCLTSLSADGGAAGALLRRLHLYNIDRMDNAALCAALSPCPSLLDLEIVGLHIELRQTLESVSKNCHFIERLFFESSKTGRDDSLKSPTCFELVNGCPHLTSLALRGFKLHDFKARILVKGFRKLKSVDFSTSYSITGSFLRNLGSGSNGGSLEVIILRDCIQLKEVEVARFLAAVLAGDFKLLRHLDISNREGLAGEAEWYKRNNSPSILPIERVLEERPEICLLAEFPDVGSFIEIVDSDMDSDALQLSLPFTSSSEGSYSSDHGSGNEDGRDVGYVVYEESSDEVDILTI